VLTLLLGLALLGGILYSAKAAANDRDKLLKFFGPGIRIVLFGTFILILLQGLLASYSLVIVQAAARNHVNWTPVALILIGAVIGALLMIKEGLSAFKRAEVEVVGVSLSRRDQTMIWHFVDRIAKRLGSTTPKNMIVGLEPNFYVTNADVKVIPKAVLHRGETLFLSLPFMRILTLAELAAVVGHELGHFRGDDTRFSMEFYPVYAGSAKALDSLENGHDNFWMSLALWPGIAILSLFLGRFEVAESTIGRERELEADRAGASVSSPMAVATLLLKFSAFAPLWGDLQDRMAAAQGKSGSMKNASIEFSNLATLGVKPNVLDAVINDVFPHPTDSHPPTVKRIESLGLTFPQVKVQNLSVDPAASAAKLIAGIEALEEHLTQQEEKMLREWATRDFDD
jgi:Zn-dependent protease with chaperone function